MRRLLVLIGIFGLYMCVFARLVQAQPDIPDTTCLEANLPEITSDNRVTLFKTSGAKIAGRLMSVDFQQSLLTIHELYRADRGASTYRFAEFEKIRFRKKGRLKPGWMLLGLVGGSVVGGYVGYHLTHEEFQPIGMTLGIMIVGGGGFLAGTIVPLMHSSEMVECELGGRRE